MAPTPYVIKHLTATDITCRLSWPSRLLPNLPGSSGQHPARSRVHFRVRDGDGRVWRLCCSTRQMGYYKPVITGDWLRFVKSKNLRAGDQVVFYEDSGPGTDFVVAVRRVGKIRLFGNNVVGYTGEE